MRSDERLLLRVAEAAELLGGSRSQAYVLIKQGQIPSLRLGQSLRVPTEGLRRWLRDATSNDRPDAPEPVA